MAGYSARQETYITGDTIEATDTSNEFDVILAAFHVTTGHSHDGSTAGEGPLLVITGALNSGSITSGFGAIDNGTSNITTGGILKVDVDGTAINGAGTLTMGAGNDAAIMWNGTNLELDFATGALQVSLAGTQVGTWDGGGIDLVSGDTFAINSTDVLSATTLGSAVVTSSLTTVGALNSGSITSGFGSIDIGASALSATGTITGPSGTWDSGGMDIAASDSYAVAGTAILSDSAGTMTLSNIDALDATTEATIEAAIDTLSNLTTVGALNSGSITSGFGNIDIGSSTFATTGTLAAGATTVTGTIRVSNAAGGAILDEAATVTNPTLIPNIADVDTGIGWSTDELHFVINGVQIIDVNVSGIFSANTAGSALANEAGSTTNPTIIVRQTDFDTGFAGDGSGDIYVISDGTLNATFAGGASPTATFAGKALIGGSASMTVDTGDLNLQVLGTDFAGSSAHFGRWAADALSPGIAFTKSRSASVGDTSQDVVLENDRLGELTFFGADGTGSDGDLNARGAHIQVYVDGTPTTNEMPSRIVFGTSGASQSPTTALTLDSSQNATFAGTLAAGAITTTGVFTQTLGGSRTSTGGDESLILTNSASAGDDVVIHTTAGTTGDSKWTMGNPSDDTLGFIKFSNNTTDMTFAVGNGNIALTLDGPTLAATFAGTLTAGAATFSGTSGLLNTSGTSGTQATFEASDAANADVRLNLYRNSASPAADDSIMMLQWLGKDSGANDVAYAKIDAFIESPTDGTEQGRLVFSTAGPASGTMTDALTLDSSQNATFAGKITSTADIGVFFTMDRTANGAVDEVFDIGVSSDGGGTSDWMFMGAAADPLLKVYGATVSGVVIGAGTLPSNPAKLWVNKDGGSVPGLDADVALLLSNTSAADDYVELNMISGASGGADIVFGDTADGQIARIRYAHGTDDMEFYVANDLSNPNFTIRDTEVVVNNGTQDVDFRVESDNESHMFVVDAGRDEVNITNRAVLVTDGRGLLNINADTSGTLFHLFTNQADADGANVVFEKAGGTPAGNDVISKQSVRSNTADLTNVEYGYSEWRIGATTDAAQEGYWRTFIYDAGTAYNALSVSADGIVLNEDGRTRFDFRVESLNRTNMIFVDASADTVTFNGPVFIKNSATTAYQWIDADATYDAQIILGSGGSTHARIGVPGATNGIALTGSLVNELVIQNRDGAGWVHLTGGNHFALSIDNVRNLYLNGNATHPTAATSAVGVFHISNGTAPSASIANGVLLYAEDVTASSELKVRDEAGNVTVLSPHNFTLIPDGPSEDMAWAHHSERDGKKINVDMLAAIREVERLSGRKLVWTE